MGVSYLKYDWCGDHYKYQEDGILKMGKALHDVGNPVIFSLSEWGQNRPWEKYSNIAHLWRTSYDIGKCFENSTNLSKTNLSWTDIIDQQNDLGLYSGPGHWNDPDMLQVGNA